MVLYLLLAEGVALYLLLAKGVALYLLLAKDVALYLPLAKGVILYLLLAKGVAVYLLLAKGVALYIFYLKPAKGVALYLLLAKGVAVYLLLAKGVALYSIMSRTQKTESSLGNCWNYVATNTALLYDSIEVVACYYSGINALSWGFDSVIFYFSCCDCPGTRLSHNKLSPHYQWRVGSTVVKPYQSTTPRLIPGGDVSNFFPSWLNNFIYMIYQQKSEKLSSLSQFLFAPSVAFGTDNIPPFCSFPRHLCSFPPTPSSKLVSLLHQPWPYIFRSSSLSSSRWSPRKRYPGSIGAFFSQNMSNSLPSLVTNKVCCCWRFNYSVEISILFRLGIQIW